MTLYQKYRPQTLDEIVGNEAVVSLLQSILSEEEKPHTFLLTGPTGCGKTTVARIIAKEMGCGEFDFTEVDSADFRGIDSVRDIRKVYGLAPMQGQCRVWLLDECHKLTNDAQNALLKALEDPPQHVYFILATTNPQKLLTTLLGRCSTLQMAELNDTQMYKLLRRVVKAENAPSMTKLVYEQIVQDSLGRPRNALQILEQVLHAEPEAQLETAKRSAEAQAQTIELCRALLDNSGWRMVSSILSGLKESNEPEAIRRAVLGYCAAVLLKKDNTQAAIIMEEFISHFYDSGWPGLIYACYAVVKG